MPLTNSSDLSSSWVIGSNLGFESVWESFGDLVFVGCGSCVDGGVGIGGGGDSGGDREMKSVFEPTI